MARVSRLTEVQAGLTAITSVLLDPEWIAAYVNESGLSTEMRLQRAAEAAEVIPGFAVVTSETIDLMDELKTRLGKVASWRIGQVTGPVTPQDYRTLGAVLLMVIMWLLVLTAPIAVQQSQLAAETQQTLDDYYGLIAGLAASITFLIGPKLIKKAGKK